MFRLRQRERRRGRLRSGGRARGPETPASPNDLFLFEATGALQYGQSGLFNFVATGPIAPTFGDLYYFKSDAAGSSRVTNFLSP